MMRRLVTLALGLLLLACASAVLWRWSTAEAPAPVTLALVPLNEQFKPAGCETACPQVQVAALQFVDAPELNTRLRERLITLAGWAAETDPVAGVTAYRAYAERLFSLDADTRATNADPAPYDAVLRAERIGRHAGVSVLRLDGYTFTGGAHGMPMTAYWQIDESTRRTLTLDDLLVAGARPRFEAALRQAHARWQAEQPGDLSDWPFVMTDNVALGARGLDVTWQVYEIAPYSYGQPTLHLGYDSLDGLVEPRFRRDDAVAKSGS